MRLNELSERKLFVCAGVLFAAGLAGLPKASAATASWALPVSGNFNTGSNWDTGLVPGALDVALFDTGSAGVLVDFSLPTTITQLGVRQDGVTFDLQGLFLNLTGVSPSNSLAVGSPGSTSSSATFQSSLPGGAVSTNNILIEAPALGTADMVVTSVNLTLTQAGSSTVTVGDNLGGGNASLAINDQATFNTGTGAFTVNASGSVSVFSTATFIANGDILIDGGSIGGLRSNSNFIWAPGNTFTVQNGGSVTSSFFSSYDSPANSTWIITGVGSSVSGAGNTTDFVGASSLSVNAGGAWTKSFSVKGGSTVTADGAVSGATLGGFDIVDGSVTLANGATSLSSFYDIGDFGAGTGTLNIQSGSTVTSNLSNGLQISSSNSDTNGVVNVTGPGSALNLVSTIIGSTSSGTGELNLSSGGTYNSSGTTRVNPTGTFIIGSGGVFNASGPTLVAGGLMDVQASGVFNVDDDLTVSGGTFRKDRLATMTMGAGVNMTVSDNGLAEFPNVFSNFNVNNSNTVTIDGINDGVGTPSELHAFGDLTVSGGSTVDVTNSGVLTVDDQLNVNATGLLLMGSNGVLNANGNILVNGGTVIGLASFNPFNWAAGNTFTVQNGGMVSGFSVSYTSPAGSSFVVTGAGSSIVGGGNTFTLASASSISVSNGGSWIKNMDVAGGSTVTADGAGSTLGAFNVIDGSVTLTNGAAAPSFLFNVGDFGTGTGTLNVLSGSTVTSSGSFNLSLVNSDSDGEVFIDGAGSSVQAVQAIIGSNIAGTALVDVSNGGSFIVTGSAALRQTGTININGGTVLLGNLADNSGTINFNTGTFGYNGDLLVGAAGMFGSNITTGIRSYIFGGAVTVEPGASLTMDGGKLSAGSLQNFGTFAFNSGTLELTSDNLEIDFGGLLGRTPTIVAGQDVIVTNSVNVSSVGVLTMNGGSVTAGTLNNGGIIQMNSLAALIDGGSVVNTGTLTGTGLVDSTLTNNLGGEVRVSTGETLIFNGTGNTNSGLIDNLDGSLQFNGDLSNNAGGVITNRGPLRLLGGLTNNGNLSLGAGNNDVFGNITNSATGQVSVAGGSTTSFFGTMANAGDVFVGFDSRATFFNAASGPGSFSGTGVVEFAGGFSPGASPAIVSFGGDLVLAGSANLLIELGGLTAGTEFDQLAVAGDVNLGGTLDVTNLNGFVLSPGMAFDLVAFGGTLTGAFSNVINSTGLGGLLLNVTSDADSVNLLLDGLAGDLNLDGFVGVDDLNIVLLNWNQSVSTGIWQSGDPTGDGFVGVDDLNVVLVNWNNGTPPTEGSAAVPEPAGLLMWGVLSVGLIRRGRRGGLV
jgi:hypothetical protein